MHPTFVRRPLLLAVVGLLAAGCSNGGETSSRESPSTVSTEPTSTIDDSTTAPATTGASSTSTAASTSTQPSPDGVRAVEFRIDPGAEIEAAPHRAVLTRLDGALTGDVVWAMPSTGSNPTGVAVGWFEGSLDECGKGGVGMAVVDDGTGDVRWETLRGTGTGMFELLSASGTGSWTLGTESGSMTGTARCTDPLDPTVFETTLVDPPTESATQTPNAFYFASMVLPEFAARLRVDPHVLPGYPGITFVAGSNPLDFGQDLQRVGAVLMSPTSSGVESVFVGLLDQPNRTAECPLGIRSLAVQPNFGSVDELHWQNLPRNGCGNRQSGLFRPVAATSTPTTTTIPPAAGAPRRPADAGPFDVNFSWYGGTKPTGYYDAQLLSWVFEGAGLTGDLNGHGAAVMIGTGALFSSASLTLHWFEGQVAGCGSGSMVIRYAMDPSRAPGSSNWEIVPGLGTGDLATITGHGSSKPPVGFTGTVDCHGLALGERPAFATTLLTPPTDQGVEAFVPAHTPVRKIVHSVRDGSVSPSPLTLEFTEYDIGARLISLTATAPTGSPGPLVNTMVGVWLGTTTCSDNGIARLVIDDVLLPGFAGAWDLAPGLNGDAAGGGPINGPGRVSCTPD